MDKSVNPCTDFYQLLRRMDGAQPDPGRPGGGWWSTAKLTNENLPLSLGASTRRRRSERSTPPCSRRSATTRRLHERAGHREVAATPLQPLLAQIAAIKSRKDLAAVLAKEQPRNLRKRWVFGFGADQDFGDATQVIAFTRAGASAFPTATTTSKTTERSKGIREKYIAHIQNMLVLIGDRSRGRSRHACGDENRDRLARRRSHASNARPVQLYTRWSAAELAKLTPSFDWNRYLSRQRQAKRENHQRHRAAVPRRAGERDQIRSARRWKAYLRLAAVHARAPYLSNAFVSENFNFYIKTLRGVTSMPPRWKQCVRYVDGTSAKPSARSSSAARSLRHEGAHRRHDEAASRRRWRSRSRTSTDDRRRSARAGEAARDRNKVGYPDRCATYPASR